jgi:hypothetical protein
MRNNIKYTKSRLQFLLLCISTITLFVSCDKDDEIPEKVTISFETNGGTTVQTIEMGYNTIATKPGNPTKANAKFWNWYTDAELKHVFDFTQPLKSDITLYAKWISTYNVMYETFGGTIFSPDTVNAGDFLQPLDIVPKKTGFKFLNWYADAALSVVFDYNLPINANTAIYAKYSDTFTVAFDSRGGTSVQPVQVKGNSYLANPVTTNPKGYSFWEWRTNEGKPFNPATQPIVEDLTLHAVWNMPATMFRVEGGKFWGLKPEYVASTEYIDIPSNLPELTTPGINDFNFYNNTVVKSISIPANFSFIGLNAFALCPNLKSLLMYGVQNIGSQIIKESGIEEINIPGTVTKISDSFALCNTLKTVRFYKPDSTPEPSLDLNWTFWASTNLESIIFERLTPPQFGANMLNSTKLKTILVPYEVYGDYKTAWPAYASFMKKQ